MTHAEAVRYIEGREILGMRFGLDRMHRILSGLGAPQDGRRAVHVVGTNGKSSTTRYAAAALRAAGCRVGAYLSPHIAHWRERMQVEGTALSEAEFAAAVGAVADVAEDAAFADDPPTQFEVLTAAAFVAFARAEADHLVIEAGLGGRYDATNVLDDAIVVLTNVSLEHTDLLGDTEYAIAGEKLAVAPDGTDRLVVGPLSEAADEAVRRIVRERRLSGWWAGDQIRLEDVGGRTEVITPIGRHRLAPPSPAVYQRWNAALAIAAAERRLDAPIPEGPLQEAIGGTVVPGRMEIVDGSPTVILDGAHNPAGMAALAAELPADRHIVAVLSVLRDKDRDAMLRPLADRVRHVVATSSSNPRALGAEELARSVRGAGIAVDDVEHAGDAVARAFELAGPDGVVVVCGSLYLLTDVRDAVLRRPSSPPGKLPARNPRK